MRTLNLAPFLISPLTSRMNGFHSANLLKSVRTVQTLPALAAISICVESSFICSLAVFSKSENIRWSGSEHSKEVRRYVPFVPREHDSTSDTQAPAKIQGCDLVC